MSLVLRSLLPYPNSCQGTSPHQQGWDTKMAMLSFCGVFARARGVLVKNDRLDARLIAEYVAIMPTRVVQRDAAVERLAEIVTMRRQLCDEHVAAENQAAHLEDAMLRRLSKRRQMRLEADIRLLDK